VWHGSAIAAGAGEDIHCEVISINAVEFEKVVERDTSLWSLYARYAQHFIDHLNKSEHREASDVHMGNRAVDAVTSLITMMYQIGGGKAEDQRRSTVLPIERPSVLPGMVN